MKKTIALALAALMLLALLTACAAKPAETKPTESSASDAAESPEQAPTPETTETAPTAEETPAEPEQPAEPALPDGVYTAEFNTDSSMFHANEACDGKGTLTVENGAKTSGIVRFKCRVTIRFRNASGPTASGVTASLPRPTTRQDPSAGSNSSSASVSTSSQSPGAVRSWSAPKSSVM